MAIRLLSVEIGNVGSSPLKERCTSTHAVPTIQLHIGFSKCVAAAVELRLHREVCILEYLLVLTRSPGRAIQSKTSLVNNFSQLGFAVNWKKNVFSFSTVCLPRHTTEHCIDEISTFSTVATDNVITANNVII